MSILGIIPARFASTRFPGKPLVEIGGKSMIQRVYEQAQKAKLQKVVVATDDQRILEQMLYLPEVTLADHDRVEWLNEWGTTLETQLNAHDDASRRYRVRVLQGTEGPPKLLVARREHGSTTEKHIHREFFESAEYRRITDLGKTLAGLLQQGAYVSKGEQRQEVTNFKQAINWLLDQARRGQMIQRYKGLGEMNPEQLWETTINPATRRLIQVRIEDALAANDIFATLMGDQVEPRREFIEKNALAVANLDV